MANAKEELIAMLQTCRQAYDAEVVCIDIQWLDSWDWQTDKKFVLKVGHTEEELTTFLDSLDFKYNDGFGLQELAGKVWLTNGVWLDRGDYDGSEWWEIHKYPSIPQELI